MQSISVTTRYVWGMIIQVICNYSRTPNIKMEAVLRLPVWLFRSFLSVYLHMGLDNSSVSKQQHSSLNSTVEKVSRKVDLGWWVKKCFRCAVFWHAPQFTFPFPKPLRLQENMALTASSWGMNSQSIIKKIRKKQGAYEACRPETQPSYKYIFLDIYKYKLISPFSIYPSVFSHLSGTGSRR